MTRAAVLATAILALFEGGVRLAVRTDLLKRDLSLPNLVRGHLEDLETKQPAIWLIGNSTLARGILLERLESATGESFARLAHGSATTRASARMLEYYGRRAPVAPRRLLLFISVDDLNPNGVRAQNSMRYDSYLSFERHSPFELLEIVRARENLRGAFLKWGRTAASVSEDRINEGDSREVVEPIFDETAFQSSQPWLRRLAEDYDIGGEAFKALADIGRDLGGAPVTVLLLPATNRFFEFHESVSPDWPLDRISREVAAHCSANGIEFVDLTDSIRDPALYRDAYHLNGKGAEVMTRIVADLLKE